MATGDDIQLKVCILPGACSDSPVLAECALDLLAMTGLGVDAGYNFYEWKG